jgi:molecular chaperone DnaK
MNKLLIGIDFGTSTNFVTKYDFKKKDALAVANMGGYGSTNIFDNCIYINTPDNFVIGDTKAQLKDPLNFFQDVKRHIVSDTWKHRIPNMGNNHEATAQDIAQMIFGAIKKKVESRENRSIDGAVITVPYEYSDKYKKRITQAAENAGIPVIKLIEEPVAAAIAFGLFSDEVKVNIEEKVLVFDLGGGTFDIAIFKFKKSGAQQAKIEVLNTNGVEKLGGKEIDDLIAKKLATHMNIDFSMVENEKERKKIQIQLDEIAKSTKEALSENEDWDIYETISVNGQNRVLELTITRDMFNAWLKNNNIIGQIQTALENAFLDIDLDPADIDRIILAGGSSNIPIIKKIVRDFFGKDAEARSDLGQLVGQGAGILAGLSEDSSLDYTIIRKTSKSIGVNKQNRLQKILSKNIPYGEESAQIPLKIIDKGKGTLIFYEGDNYLIEDCEKIGKIKLDSVVLDEDEIKLALLKEEQSGMIQYRIYSKNNRLLANGAIDEYES